MGLAASSASANDVWLWACHGPDGRSITDASKVAWTGEGVVAGDCTTSGNTTGYTLSFADATPADGSTASVAFNLPAGLNAKAVKLNRTLRGFEGATGVSLKVNDQPAADGPITAANTVTLELSCSTGCTGSPQVDVASLALQVSDTTAPQGGINWNTPVDKAMPITPAFTDQGVGLDRAVVTIDGYPGLTKTKEFNSNLCAELSPADGTNDRPLNPTACLQGASQGDGKPLGPLTVLLEPDSLALPEGTYTRTVTVYDAAGNATPISGSVEVWHPPAPQSVRTLNISTASVNELPSGNNNNQGGSGGVQGAQRNQCRSPRLSVTLRSKPVRVTKNVPVLQYKKSYRFTGRLTCVINGKRQSAPKRTKLSILNKVGKKTVRKPNTAIRSKGGVDVKLAFVSSRTVIFRYTNADGQKSEVKIKVRVTKQKK